MGFIYGLRWLWLLCVAVSAGVIRQLEEDQEPCITYVQVGLLYVDCSNRGLRELPEDIDVNAQVVILANNNFKEIPQKLNNFLQIEILDLSGNGLSWSIMSDYSQLWQRLKILNLSNNNYDTWQGFQQISNLIKLDLSKNSINTIDPNAFYNMPQLAILDLSENRLHNISSELFSQATSLEVLTLSRNYLSTFPDFESISLTNLHLSSCQVTNIGINSLRGMRSLLELDLSMNLLEVLPDSIVSTSLQELNLSYNNLYKITDLTFSSLPHLAVLDLRGNDFKEIWSSSHFASNPFLREVQVKGNRWSCEGFSVNLLLTYEFLTKEPPKVSDNSLICYSPANVTKMTWQEAYILTWHSNDTSMQTFTLSAIIIGMIIGIVLTSLVCRLLISLRKSDEPQERLANNISTTTQQRAESVVLRVPLREDLPPTYDEALLMPRLNDSFYSLPDFVDEQESNERNPRRSRSIGDLTETRPRLADRRSVRRTVEIHIN